MKIILTLTWSLVSLAALSQDKDLPFGKATYADLDMKTYPKDTSASAVVLNEIGSASAVLTIIWFLNDTLK